MDKSLRRRFLRTNAAFLEELLRRIADDLHALIPGSPKFGVLLFHSTEGAFMASITVPDNSAALAAAVSFLDAEGQPTTADDVPVWTSSDESVAVVTASEDGLSASVEIGAPGVALIDVTTTNDDGSTATAEGTITVQPGDAVIGEVTFTESA